jgi:hypothetical protein
MISYRSAMVRDPRPDSGAQVALRFGARVIAPPAGSSRR